MSEQVESVDPAPQPPPVEAAPPPPQPAPRQASTVVQKEDRKPCGCIETHYADTRVEVRPCLGCGLGHASKALADAAQAMMAASQIMRATGASWAAPARVGVIDHLRTKGR